MEKSNSIIGLLTTTDSGKSLLQDYFRKNFSNMIFESTNRGDVQIDEGIKRYKEFNTNEIIEIIKTWGCDSFPMPDIKKRINKQILKNIYTYVTYKNKIFTFVRCEDYNYYCDKGIFVARDVRARWAVTQHREGGVKNYLSAFVPHLNNFIKIKDKRSIYILKFEELINDAKKYIDEICNFLELNYDTKFIHSTPQYNEWFTTMDLRNIRTYVDDGRLLKQEELDHISEETYKYNKIFNYPERLLIEDLYPTTLQYDIDKHMNSIKEN